jgi:hypothetical protein
MKPLTQQFFCVVSTISFEAITKGFAPKVRYSVLLSGTDAAYKLLPTVFSILAPAAPRPPLAPLPPSQHTSDVH